MVQGPVPDSDAIAEGALPREGFDELYDDSRHNSPEVNLGPDKGLSNRQPCKENRRSNKPPNVESSPRTIFPANSQLIDTSPAAPTPGVSVHETKVASSSRARSPILSWLGTTSPILSRRRNNAARDSNRIPDVVEIINVDAPVTRPNAAAGSSNRIPDDAEIFDVDAWEARRCLQVTHPTSDLPVQVGSPAPGSPVQGSSRTLLQSEQIAVDFLASNSQSRNIPQEPSGSRTGSNAKPKDSNSFSGPQTKIRFSIDIETARQNGSDELLGAALFCAFADDCHKRIEIRKGKQRDDEAPLSPLYPSIENDSSSECESCDEDAANVEYIYNVRGSTQTCHGTELKTIKAHPGNAVWALAESRLGSGNDPRKWETACSRCSDERREQTIPLEDAAVDDKKNRFEGAAPYNSNLYTTTSSTRELRLKPQKSRARLEHVAMSSNRSASPSPDQAPSSGSNQNGKQKANGDRNSNDSQPTPRIASARATSSRSIGRGTREANGNVNNNASGTQACSPPPPSPPTRLSLRNRRLFALEPQVPPLPPAPAASSSRHSKRSAPSPLGQTFDRVSATTPEQVQTFSNNKRKANDAVEDVDRGYGPVARARRKMVSNSSNELGASQQRQRSAALAAGSETTSSGTHSTTPATAPRSEGSSERRGRLRLHLAPEANPEHPDHKAYLARGQGSRKTRKG